MENHTSLQMAVILDDFLEEYSLDSISETEMSAYNRDVLLIRWHHCLRK